MLQPEHKEHRAAVANDSIPATTDKPRDFLEKVETGEEWSLGAPPGSEGPVIPMEVAWLSGPGEGVAKSQQD